MSDAKPDAELSRWWLDWPVKVSLRRYIEALPDGSIGVQDGAVIDADTFRWPASAQADGEPTSYLGRGELCLRGHGGLLVIALSAPAVRVGADGGTLEVDYPWASDRTESPIVIARLSMTAEPRTYGVTLTDDGAELFNNYAAGAEMAPLRIRRS